MKLLQAQIVPWSLPKEEIPFNVKWPKDIHFDGINIKLPNNLELKELLNVKDYQIKKNIIEIKKIHSVKSVNEIYFGGVVSTKDIPVNLSNSDNIVIELLDNGKVIDNIIVTAKTFRPRLELTDYPKEILLSDDKKIAILPICLRYVGFGDIKIKFEATLQGKLVSGRDTIIHELVRRLKNSKLVEDDFNEAITQEDITIDPQYIDEIVLQIERYMNSKNPPLSELDSDDIEYIKEWMKKLRTKKIEFYDFFKNKVSNLLIEIIDELISINPTENVSLESNWKITGRIKAPAENLKVKILYSDSLDNIYDPLEFQVQLIDKRENKGVMFEIDVNIEKVQSEPYLNVSQMNP